MSIIFIATTARTQALPGCEAVRRRSRSTMATRTRTQRRLPSSAMNSEDTIGHAGHLSMWSPGQTRRVKYASFPSFFLPSLPALSFFCSCSPVFFRSRQLGLLIVSVSQSLTLSTPLAHHIASDVLLHSFPGPGFDALRVCCNYRYPSRTDWFDLLSRSYRMFVVECLCICSLILV